MWPIAIGVVIGLVFTWFAGELILPRLMAHLDDQYKNISIPEGGEIGEDVWRALMTRRPGGIEVGRVERLVFFGSLVSQSWALVTAWLVFKVAVNWQWARNINALPNWLMEHKDARYIPLRVIWGSHAVVSFT